MRRAGRTEQRDPVGRHALEAGGCLLHIAALDDFQRRGEVAARQSSRHLSRVGVQCGQYRPRTLNDLR